MNQTPILLKAGQFQDLQTATRDAATLSLYPGTLAHVYIRLDMDDQYERPTTSDDALSYLRAVANAATIAEAIAQAYAGRVLEVQGSTIHVGLPDREDSNPNMLQYTAALNTAFRRRIEPVYSAVVGWRMTADVGKTLVVPGRGVHGDLSFVSLGNAANRPAKHLYAELSRPEANRKLKKYYLGVRDPSSGQWSHLALGVLTEERLRQSLALASTSEDDFSVQLGSLRNSGRLVTATAAPIGQPGGYGSPTAEKPGVFFGWVMRADLDGFTRRVQKCLDDDDALMALGGKFVNIMDAAAAFTARHNEFMVQLPWAGDNFTAAVVFSSKDGYDEARPKRPISHALDFNGEMALCQGSSEFNGWAFGVGGADVHGNAAGNVFVGSVEFDDRRFLVGTGQGFGRSLQAFADLKPDSDELALYTEDHAVLDTMYKSQFNSAKKEDDTTSSLFKIANQSDLEAQRLSPQTANRGITISAAAGGMTTVVAKPYAHE